jgi:hypothetical protein
MSRHARSEPTSVASGSTPRSKRIDASVDSSRRRRVRWMPSRWKVAASRRTSVVLGEISASSPPITPATPTGRSASQINRSSSVNVRSTSSSVVMRSPSAARRTTMPGPLSSGRSNGCSGCPISSIA